MCVFAYAISLIVYQLGGLLMGGAFGVGTAAALILLAVLLFLVFRPNRYNADYSRNASVSVKLRRKAGS